tara:strand:+ start:18816 stop:19283 length:468 start_codon:yes stop_codon:yes gene_type:complete
VIKHNFDYYLQVAFLLNIIQYVIYLNLTDHKLRFNIFIITITLLAIIIDSIFYNLGWVLFNNNDFYYISPIWLMIMWNNFSVTFYITSQYFFNKPYILSILVLIFVPLAYFYIEFFKAMYIKSSFILLCYGLIWAILFPCICVFTKDNKILSKVN